MRIILPAPLPAAADPPSSTPWHVFFIGTSLASQDAGNGQSQIDHDIIGGWIQISGNTIADSRRFNHRRGTLDTNYGGVFPGQFWLHPAAISHRMVEHRMDAQGAVSVGLGDMGLAGSYTNLRTNIAAKRVLLTIERDAGGTRIAYFVWCNGSVVNLAIVPEPVMGQRITVRFRPAKAVELFYDSTLIASSSAVLPTGLATNVSGLPTAATAGWRIHKTPTGAAVNRLSAQGCAIASPDI